MNRITIALSSLAGAALLLAPAFASAQGLGVSATVSASTTVSAKGEATAKTRADTEIDRRVTILDAVQARISAMTRISASDKAALSSGVSTQLSAMASLKAQIDAETDLTNLKTEIESITKGYRIFMLVVPQARIEASADRALDIVADMQTLSAKLQARITADTGSNQASLQSSYADMQAKMSDASVNANAAVSEVASLSPDNGNTTVEASNTASLKDAHAKMLTATADLKAAYADSQTIIAGVKGTGSVTASTSATVE